MQKPRALVAILRRGSEQNWVNTLAVSNSVLKMKWNIYQKTQSYSQKWFSDCLYDTKEHLDSVFTCSSGMIVPLSGQDPPNVVRGKGSTIGLGLMKLLMSQDGGSTSVLCMTTLSTTMNLFQDSQSVLFTERKGDLSKTRVTEMPPIATRSKLQRKKQNISSYSDPIRLDKYLFKKSTFPPVCSRHLSYVSSGL